MASTQEFTPPYPPFKTFTNFLEGLEEKQEQFPPRIDRSYLRGLSGISQSQLLATLRAFELIDEGGNITPALKELATQPEDRPKLVADLVRNYYPEMVKLGEENATGKMLEDAFAEHGLTGSTRRKAISFFLKAASWGGIKLSPHFAVPRATGSSNGKTGGKRKRQAKRRTGEAEDAADLAPKESANDPKQQYVQLLLKKAEEDMDDSLLDRIERVIGLDNLPAKTEEPEP
jgi:hypothetical protein